MVPPAGKKTRAGQLRYLNPPRPIRVLQDRQGEPRTVVLERKGHPVEKVRDQWRIDDTWWRDPICRMYWEVELRDGRVLTVFHDRIADQWYEQRYG
jgi:hypothetical protein